MNSKNPLTTGKNLTIVIPVYNEAEGIEFVINEIYDKIINFFQLAKLIIIEDGSTDGTKEILARLNQKRHFILISRNERRGFPEAFKESLGLVKTKYAFFCDSDGQFEPADFFNLYNFIEDYDIVGGYRPQRTDPYYRILLAKIFNATLRAVFGVSNRDIDSSFKILRKEVIEDILDEIGESKYCIMWEFIVRANYKGYKIIEVPISHRDRIKGKSNIYSVKNIPFVAYWLLKKIIKIKLEQIKNNNISRKE